MKKITFKLLMTGCLLGVVSASAYSQEKKEFRFYTSKDTLKNEIVDIIRNVEEKMFQDPGAPRFLLIDKNEKFALGIGGQARGVVGSEFGGIINSSTDYGFQPSLIPMPYGENPRSQLRMSAATSQLFVKMVGRTKRIGDIETFVSIDFQGNNYTPRLRQAYVKLGGLTFGQAWSTFTDVNAIPPTIDFAGPVSMVIVRNPLVRYTYNFSQNRFKVALAAEFPQVNVDYSNSTKATPQAVPDIIGYYQFNWGKTKANHIRVSGLLRNMSYRNLESSKSEMEQGWGVQFSSVFNITRKLQFFGQGIFGKGIASYMNDPSTQNIDLVPYNNRLGALDKLKMWGASATLQYALCKNVYGSTTYSYTRVYENENVETSPFMYKFSQYIATNVFWNITNDCSVGIEYLRGMKNVLNGDMGHANRMNIMVQYNF